MSDHRLVISNVDDLNDFWSNDAGWVDIDGADRFDIEAVQTLDLPCGGQWVLDTSDGADWNLPGGRVTLTVTA